MPTADQLKPSENRLMSILIVAYGQPDPQVLNRGHNYAPNGGYSENVSRSSGETSFASRIADTTVVAPSTKSTTDLNMRLLSPSAATTVEPNVKRPDVPPIRQSATSIGIESTKRQVVSPETLVVHIVL